MIGVQTITLDGWKGVTRTFHLGQLNLIKGANGTGKSAIITALRWACTGETEIGRDLESVLKYCAADGAAVTVTLTDGFEWTRSIARGLNGKNNSETVTIAGKSSVNSTTAKVLIAEHVGDIAEAWGEAFLVKSAEEKRDRIVDLVGQYDRRNGSGTARDPGRVLRDIALHFFAQQVGSETVKLFLETRGCPCPDAATDEAIQAFAERYASPEDLDIIKRTIQELAAEVREDLSETINSVLAKSEELEKRYARDAKQGGLTAEGIAKRKAEIVLVGTPAVELRRQLDAALEDEKAIIAAKSAAEAHERHVQTLRDTIGACDSAIMQACADLALLAERPAAMPEEESGLNAAATAKDAEAEAARKRLAKIETRQQKAQEAWSQARERLAQARTQEESRTRLASQIEADAAEMERLEAAIGDAPVTADGLQQQIAALESVKLPSADAVNRLSLLVSTAKDEAAARNTCHYDLIVASAKLDAADAAIQSAKSGPWGKMKGLIALVDPHVAPPGRKPWESLCGIVADNVAASKLDVVETEARRLRDAIDAGTKRLEAAEATRRKREAELVDARKRLGEENEDYASAQIGLRELRERAAAMKSWTDLGQRVHQAKTELLSLGGAQCVAGLEDETRDAFSCLNAIRVEWNNVHAQIEALTAEAAELRQQATESRAAVDRDRRRQAELEREQESKTRERDEASARLAGLGAVEPVADLVEKLSSAKVRVSGLQVQLTARQRWETIDAEYKRAIADAEAHKRGHEIANGFSAAIRMVREAMMHALTDPLRRLMDRFFGGVEDGLSAYVTIDNEPGRKRLVFHLGWCRTGGRVYGPESPVMTGGIVDQAVLSGGEKPLFLAALADAIAVLADPPLRLLMLAVSEADPSNLSGLIRGIASRSEDFGTALVEVWEHPRRPLPELPLADWNIIDMGAAGAVAAPPMETSTAH